MIHCRLSVEKCSAFWADGIAMVTIVASSTTISCAMLSRARTAHRFGSRSVESTDMRVSPFVSRVNLGAVAEVEADRLHDPEGCARGEHVGRRQHAGVLL